MADRRSGKDRRYQKGLRRVGSWILANEVRTKIAFCSFCFGYFLYGVTVFARLIAT